MGAFKRDYSDVERREAGEGYSGEVPRPGIYPADLVSCKEHTSAGGNEGTEWIFRINDGPYKDWQGWVYTNDGSAAWKETQILEAVGILKPGQDDLSTTHEKIVQKAKACRVKVKNETYEEEKKGKITTILPPAKGQGEGGSGSASSDDGDDDKPF